MRHRTQDKHEQAGHVALADVVHQMTIYAHEEKDDVNPNERKEMATYAHELKNLVPKERDP